LPQSGSAELATILLDDAPPHVAPAEQVQRQMAVQLAASGVHIAPWRARAHRQQQRVQHAAPSAHTPRQPRRRAQPPRAPRAAAMRARLPCWAPLQHRGRFKEGR
jgi:hypothetical protein